MKRIISGLFLNAKHFFYVLLAFYLLNLVLGRIPGKMTKAYLNNEIGHSTAIDKHPEQFDFTMITDFLINHGSGVGVLFSVLILVFLLYFLIHTFLLAGWLKSVLKMPLKISRGHFLEEATSRFWPLLRLEFYVILIYVLVLGLANFGFAAKGLNPFEQISDVALMNRFLLCNGIAFLLMFFVGLWHQLARFYVIDNEQKLISSAIKSSISAFKSNVLLTIVIQLIYFIFVFLLLAVAIFIFDQFSLSSDSSQWIYILIIQALVLALIYFKLTKYYVFSRLHLDVSNRQDA